MNNKHTNFIKIIIYNKIKIIHNTKNYTTICIEHLGIMQLIKKIRYKINKRILFRQLILVNKGKIILKIYKKIILLSINLIVAIIIINLKKIMNILLIYSFKKNKKKYKKKYTNLYIIQKIYSKIINNNN